jgi:hypothetical protein
MAATTRALKIAAGVGALFFALIALILYLGAKGVVTPQMALLMLIALFGMYVGFGVLVAVYRFMSKLE